MERPKSMLESILEGIPKKPNVRLMWTTKAERAYRQKAYLLVRRDGMAGRCGDEVVEWLSCGLQS
jgi:hypothetical protein